MAAKGAKGADQPRTVEHPTDEQRGLTEQQRHFEGPPLPDKAQLVHEVSIGAAPPQYVDRWGTHPARTAGWQLAEGRADDDGRELATKSDATAAEAKTIREG